MDWRSAGENQERNEFRTTSTLVAGACFLAYCSSHANVAGVSWPHSFGLSLSACAERVAARASRMSMSSSPELRISRSDRKPEMHDISVTYDVFLALEPHGPGIANRGLALVLHEVV